jgi:hypothetical protein
MALEDDVRIGRRGEMTVPKPIRAAYVAAFGVELTEATATLRDDGVIELRPQLRIDPTQAFFWSTAWQQAEAQAQDDITDGRLTRYDSGDAFLESLEES